MEMGLRLLIKKLKCSQPLWDSEKLKTELSKGTINEKHYEKPGNFNPRGRITISVIRNIKLSIFYFLQVVFLKAVYKYNTHNNIFRCLTLNYLDFLERMSTQVFSKRAFLSAIVFLSSFFFTAYIICTLKGRSVGSIHGVVQYPVCTWKWSNSGRTYGYSVFSKSFSWN